MTDTQTDGQQSDPIRGSVFFPFEVRNPKNKKKTYLHSSPEILKKKFLSEFQILSDKESVSDLKVSEYRYLKSGIGTALLYILAYNHF